MRARPSLTFAAGAVFGLAGALALGAALSSVPAPAERAGAGPTAGAAAARGQPASGEASPAAIAEADMRERIRASIAATLAERLRGRQLEIFIEELERRARQQGKVTALEIETGLAAIGAAHPGEPERELAFTRRMESLGRELSAVAGDEPARATPAAAVPVLLQTIGAQAPGPDRDRLLAQALAGIRALPVEEQDEALRALDRATQAHGPPLTTAGRPEDVAAAERQD